MSKQFGIDVSHEIEAGTGYVKVELTMSLANLAKLSDNTTREYSQYFHDERERIKAEVQDAITVPAVPKPKAPAAKQPPLPGL